MEELKGHIGDNIKQLRLSAGLTQKQLADRCELSRTNISYLESGGANPTISLLMQVCGGLQVHIDEVLKPPRQEVHIYKAAQMNQIHTRGVHVTELVGENIPGFQFEKVSLDPDSHKKGTPHLPGTKEYLVNLSGGITLFIEGEKYVLKSGDCIAFPGDRKHAYSNPKNNSSVNISVVVFN